MSRPTTYLEDAMNRIADAQDAMDLVVNSRSVSLAKTKLDEAMLWAQRASFEMRPKADDAS